MKSYEELWAKVLQLLEAESNEVTFDTWFKPLTFQSIDETKEIINILCDTPFAKNIIEDRYKPLIEGCIQGVFKRKLRLNIILGDQSPKKEEKPIYSTTSTSNEDFRDELIINPRYTFENFIEGDNNKYARMSCIAVSENPATRYNPLYLYGAPGLGKTHLMHAICNQIFKTQPNMKVLYVTSEIFTNELINAIKNGKNIEYRDKYRQVDVLLIDDVQFFQGKEQTQQELFNTFNDLFVNNKQIVLSSDRPPKELVNLDERLRSRFQSNIIADISRPTYETRMAILEKKAEEENLFIDENIHTVLSMIAERVQNNVRELEGAFTNLLAISRMLYKDITPQFAKENLKNIFTGDEKDISVESIKRAVAKYFNITIKDIDGKKRSREIAHPRQIAMYITRELTDLSFPKIGSSFGGKDHTTVLHAYEKIIEELKMSESTKKAVEEIENKIKL